MAFPRNPQYSPTGEMKYRRRNEAGELDGSRAQPTTILGGQFGASTGGQASNGDDSMESSLEGTSALTTREHLNGGGSSRIYSQFHNSNAEPEPSSVAARLKQQALDNPQQEQSVDDLLNSIGVSLHANQKELDYSMAVDYGGPDKKDGFSKYKLSNSSHSGIKRCQTSDSIPVAVALSRIGNKHYMSNKSRSIMQPSTQPQTNLSPPTVAPHASREGFVFPTLDKEVDTSIDLGSKSLEPQEPSGNVSEVLDASIGDRSEEMAEPSHRMKLSSLESSQDISNGPFGVPSFSSAASTPVEMSVAKGESVFDTPQQIPGEKIPKELVQGLQTDYPGDDEIESRTIDVPSFSVTTVDATIPSQVILQKSSSLHSGESSASVSPSLSVVLATTGLVANAPYTDESFNGEFNRSGADESSVMYSPESIQINSGFYTPKSYDSVEERSELVNIANHGGDRPAIPPVLPWKKGGCAGCGKGNLLLEKEYCMACGAKYCGSCVLQAMGSMPEGRKCISCLGQPIAGPRRPYIGKPSRLLRHLLSPLEVQQIMKAEKECPANQLRPEQVVVNNRPLSHEELAVLLGCQLPPGRLKPGKYWYDGQTGLWGKEGHRPDRIVTPSLKVGGNLQPNASNGKTQVFMNGRELGKLELKMLKFAGVNCVPNTLLWVEHDGSYSEEGFKNVKGNIWAKEGNLWEKASIKLLYPFFSLPTPRSTNVNDCERHSNRFLGLADPLKVHKLLLLGHEGSGRSTIFKQAKILYNDGFTPEEYASFKTLIQANIYKYMAILLEGREHFEEEDDELANVSAKNHLDDTSVVSKENGDPSSSQPDAARFSGRNDENQKPKRSSTGDNIYRLEPNLKELSDWFMDNMVCGNLESMSTSTSAHLQDHASKIEQLWLSSAVQATFQRRSELPFLPDLASFFLNRVVDVCRSDYEPAEIDILRTEGLSQGSGLVQIEITLDDNPGSWQDVDTTTGLDRYQVIRVGGKGMSDRHKWLDMFEDVRAVVFCVALSDYNSLWNDRSGNPSNKMIQTRDLFESILRHPCFQDTPFVLLLNKYDVFEDKIEQGVPLTTCTWFSDFRPVGTSHYTAQNQAQQAYQYIAHKYKELFNSVDCTGRKLFTFQLNALDKTTVSGAFNYVKQILKWDEQKAAGWGIIPDEMSSYSTDISSFSRHSSHSMTRQPDLFRRQHHY
ncbi:extra-large guanine nucleotide-binding protein 3 isoform X2 [Physcomitrium patens]|uniref:Uncharacterized protein n=1 Tax=Physcomitrium patens TaxID=3218 RepID=A0A2K1LBH5_PHYPA|nr:extra-large guanine nucleotide-binding protein 3-like isoform X2 [Physcomitrium patens]PNR63380.1 hypothetical protein PHYPA_001806 [Physcomitrium patens]|eukprot:XP_024377731.1 extra-large guanine nucleotide-binding protein 3-like isoform X2 [Physcomitrella patens]